MNIKTKLTMAFLLVALVPVSLVGSISMIESEAALKESIGARFREIAGEKAAAVSRVLEKRILDTRNLAALPLVMNAIGEANRGYAGMGESEIRENIARIDGEWIASGGTSPEADKALNNPLAAYLTTYQEYNLSHIGEIFVTDRRGAAVAMTGVLTDYYQADEQWWTEAFGESVFIDDRGYDLSTNAIITGVVVPVKEQGETIGILKVNYRIGEIIDIVTRAHTKSQERLILARSNGSIIIDSGGSREERLSDTEMAHLSDNSLHDSHFFSDEHQGWNGQAGNSAIILESHAPVMGNISTRAPSPGAVKGVSGERWEPVTWHLFVEMDQEEAFAGIAALRQVFMAVVVTVLIGSAVIWLWISRSISRPILALREDAEIIGSGNLDHRIDAHAADEIGVLSRSFNQMASRLKETLASRDELNREIEERKQAEEELLAAKNKATEAEDRLNEAVRIAKIGHWVFDEVNDRLTHCSEEYARIYGYTREELLANIDSTAADVELAHPDDHERLEKLYREAVAQGRRYEDVHRVVRKDGKVIYVHEIGKPLYDDHGRCIQTFGISMDITELKQAEERLVQDQKMKAVGHLTGGVAHEFNNLLQAIMGNLHMLRDYPGGQAETAEMLNDAIAASKRGGELTQQLLSFSRRQTLFPEVVNINDSLSGISRLLQGTLGVDISLETKFAKDLVSVNLDPGSFESAIINLALNARSAMPTGGTVTIETANLGLEEAIPHEDGELPAGKYVAVTVSDTGCGMPPEVLERAFEPFFSTRDVGQGTGLGLSMVYGFTRQSGGHTTIDSEPGKGTTVRIYLPIAEAEAVVEPDEPENGKAETKGSGTVLVVEDDPHVLKTTIRFLELIGYEALGAGDGPSALELLQRRGDVDLVFGDVIMPKDMSGIDLAETIHREHKGVRVLLVSGYPISEIDQDGTLEDRFELLRKPYTDDELATAVKDAIEG